MYAFDYEKAKALAEAGASLTADADARLLAGGMTLLPSMKHRLTAPSRLIDIGGLEEMRGIELSGSFTGSSASLSIGAAMRHCVGYQ